MAPLVKPSIHKVEYIIVDRRTGRMFKYRAGGAAVWTPNTWNPQPDLCAAAAIFPDKDDAVAEIVHLGRIGYDCTLLWAPPLSDRLVWYRENERPIHARDAERAGGRDRL